MPTEVTRAEAAARAPRASHEDRARPGDRVDHRQDRQASLLQDRCRLLIGTVRGGRTEAEASELEGHVELVVDRRSEHDRRPVADHRELLGGKSGERPSHHVVPGPVSRARLGGTVIGLLATPLTVLQGGRRVIDD